MDSITSVSKGCFVFKPYSVRAIEHKKNTKSQEQPLCLLGKDLTAQPYYESYLKTWQNIEADINSLQNRNHYKTLKSLVKYIGRAYSSNVPSSDVLPTAALLTGINQPDHHEQFNTLSRRIKKRLPACVCCIQSRDCTSVKAAIETMVYGFIKPAYENQHSKNIRHKRLRRSKCTMRVLIAWYLSLSSRTTLVVVLPDFECFIGRILQDFILILSSYCSKVPFVLVLGVSTAESTLHSILPYHVTSKIRLKIFKTHTAPIGFNEVFRKVLLAPKMSIHLSGKTLSFLTNVFLFYDFSVNGFIQGLKFCVMEHFFRGNAYSLCKNYTSSLKLIKSLTHDDMESIRRLISFRPYVEALNNSRKVISILTDDEYLKKKLPKLLRKLHKYFILFRTFLEFFTLLVHDLPNCPLGKFQRELYINCICNDLTNTTEFKESWQILSLMSKDEFVEKVSRSIAKTLDFIKRGDTDLAEQCEQQVNEVLGTIKQLLTNVTLADTQERQQDSAVSKDFFGNLRQISRQDLKETLLKMSKQEKPTSDYTKLVIEILQYIKTNVIEKFLAPLSKAPPLHELFVFSNIATFKKNIVGAPRAALHMSLNNPHYYLHCMCCELNSSSTILPTLPDLSVAYKLHLESGKMVNLFDWLQAFRSVVDYKEAENDLVDPKIQVRFTRAVAELQFMGYIKSSKRKTHHVTRLTW